MNRTVVFTLAGFLLIGSSAWAAGDDGAALYKKSVRLVTERVAKVSRR
jgi:hypothetical protein